MSISVEEARRVLVDAGELCASCEEETPYGTSRYCYICIIAGDAPLDEDDEPRLFYCGGCGWSHDGDPCDPDEIERRLAELDDE